MSEFLRSTWLQTAEDNAEKNDTVYKKIRKNSF